MNDKFEEFGCEFKNEALCEEERLELDEVESEHFDGE